MALKNRRFLALSDEILMSVEKPARYTGNEINMVKNVIYVLYDLYNSNFQFLLQNVSREYLINLYFLAVDNKPDTLLNYYKKSIINSSTNYKKI